MVNDTEKSHYSFFIFMGMDLKAVFCDISFRKLEGTDESGVAEVNGVPGNLQVLCRHNLI